MPRLGALPTGRQATRPAGSAWYQYKFMHDLVAAQDIVKTATEIARKNKLKKINRVVIKLGKIVKHNEELKPENLQFNFKLVRNNTIADKAKLIIKKGTGRELSIIEIQGEK